GERIVDHGILGAARQRAGGRHHGRGGADAGGQVPGVVVGTRHRRPLTDQCTNPELVSCHNSSSRLYARFRGPVRAMRASGMTTVTLIDCLTRDSAGCASVRAPYLTYRNAGTDQPVWHAAL